MTACICGPASALGFIPTEVAHAYVATHWRVDCPEKVCEVTHLDGKQRPSVARLTAGGYTVSACERCAKALRAQGWERA